MADPIDPRSAPGIDAAVSSFTTASKSLQTFATEMQRMSKESFDHTTQLMDKLRTVKSIEDVVSIQTSFLQQSFANYADYTRRFSELMMTLPLELATQSRSAFQKGTDTVTRATEQAGQEIRQAGEQFNQHQG